MLVLYIFQVKSVGKHDLTELLQLKHHLYDALLWCTMLADDLIASPMDQMLFLSSILPIRYYCISGKLTSLVVYQGFVFNVPLCTLGGSALTTMNNIHPGRWHL